jgi:hypothetical protein
MPERQKRRRFLLSQSITSVQRPPTGSPGFLNSSRAPRRGMTDPRETREELSVILLDHRTYLKAKAVRESSMFGKARIGETAYKHLRTAIAVSAEGRLRNGNKVARRGPTDKVKAKLLKPKYPFHKVPWGWTRRNPLKQSGNLQLPSRIRSW